MVPSTQGTALVLPFLALRQILCGHGELLNMSFVAGLGMSRESRDTISDVTLMSRFKSRFACWSDISHSRGQGQKYGRWPRKQVTCVQLHSRG